MGRATFEISNWTPGYYDNRDNQEAESLQATAADALREPESKERKETIQGVEVKVICLHCDNEGCDMCETEKKTDE